MTHTFDYFYGKESDQFSFIRIPKLLFTDKAFSDISNDAKILYALMLDRMALSRQNEWFDEENRVYIIFTIEEAAEMMSCGNEKIIKLFKELDDNTGIGLITRKRRGLGKPSIIYVRNFVVNDNSVNNGDDNNDQNQDIGKTEVLKSENPNSRDLKNGITDIGKSECNNTKYNKTEMNHTYNQSNQSDCEKIPKEIQRNKFSVSDNDELIDRLKSILSVPNGSIIRIAKLVSRHFIILSGVYSHSLRAFSASISISIFIIFLTSLMFIPQWGMAIECSIFITLHRLKPVFDTSIVIPHNLFDTSSKPVGFSKFKHKGSHYSIIFFYISTVTINTSELVCFKYGEISLCKSRIKAVHHTLGSVLTFFSSLFGINLYFNLYHIPHLTYFHSPLGNSLFS